MPPRSAWARPRGQCQRRQVRGRAGTKRRSWAWRSPQKRACRIPGRQIWPGSQAGVPRQPDGTGRSAWRPGGSASHAGLPFTAAHPRERPLAADGRRNCGSLEAILWRQWDPASPPSREVVAAVDRLAELPERIKERLADGLDAIFIGPGGVPELDDMTSLRGVPLPGGRATWDACAGAYGERKIVVGSRPSPLRT